MSGAPYLDAIAPSAAAYKAVAAAEGVRSLATANRQKEESELREDEAKRARLVALEDEDGALRHLDGAEAVPEKPQRTKTLAALNSRIPRRKAAIPILKQRESEAERLASEARLPFTSAVMQTVSLIQDPAAEQMREVLMTAEQSLCDLLVADMIRHATIGDRYSVPSGQKPPFDGGTVVRKFLAAIPPRLLPAQLTFERIEARARAAATVAICSIKENR